MNLSKNNDGAFLNWNIVSYIQDSDILHLHLVGLAKYGRTLRQHFFFAFSLGTGLRMVKSVVFRWI